MGMDVVDKQEERTPVVGCLQLFGGEIGDVERVQTILAAAAGPTGHERLEALVETECRRVVGRGRDRDGPIAGLGERLGEGRGAVGEPLVACHHAVVVKPETGVNRGQRRDGVRGRCERVAEHLGPPSQVVEARRQPAALAGRAQSVGAHRVEHDHHHVRGGGPRFEPGGSPPARGVEVVDVDPERGLGGDGHDGQPVGELGHAEGDRPASTFSRHDAARQRAGATAAERLHGELDGFGEVVPGSGGRHREREAAVVRNPHRRHERGAGSDGREAGVRRHLADGGHRRDRRHEVGGRLRRRFEADRRHQHSEHPAVVG